MYHFKEFIISFQLVY